MKFASSDKAPTSKLWRDLRRINWAKTQQALRKLYRHLQARCNPSKLKSFQSFGSIEHDPLISILIVSFNSGRDLVTLFTSISAQYYTNYEVILVENGEEDTEPLLRQHFPKGRFIRADNVGFAEGNNIAFSISSGELVALINPDTRLAPDMLQNLLAGMRFDGSVAAVVPKIWFFERFVQLRISADVPFTIKREQILEGLNYRKLFIVNGSDQGETLSSDENGILALHLPYENPRRAIITLRSKKPITICQTQIDFATPQRTLAHSCKAFSVEIMFNASNCGNARYITNNAGSMFRADGTPFDRGFAEFDDGRYQSKCYVDALCGCAALIRRTAILNRKLFFGPFFAYYEDTELSHWMSSQGYKILYQPSAQVFHRHSESTNEYSLSWQVLVGRGLQIYKATIQRMDADLSRFSVNYPTAFDGPLRAKLETFDADMRQAVRPGALLAPIRPTACVYNSYFYSMGGGEKHALDVATLLRENYEVYLASETDFEIAQLESYFSVDLSGVRKIIRNRIDTHFSSKFDLFINSTYLSKLIPAAKENIYIVSFPQRRISRLMLERYHFLHNSVFTGTWANAYWGDHKMTTVLPILGQNIPSLITRSKEKVILSVGRFTYGGHCKNHHNIVIAFVNLVEAGRISADWRLEIVGSCNFASGQAIRYHQDLISAAEGKPITIRANVSREELDDAYARSAIYVHATGLGTQADRPELHEHFGITSFEAMANGCIPVVYHLGGPSEQVAGLTAARVFSCTRSLEEELLAAVRTFEDQNGNPSEIRDHAARIIDGNRTNFLSFVSTLIPA